MMPEPDINLNKTVKGYKFIQYLGKGSFGKVYLAEDPTKKQYAIKMIPKSNFEKQ